jgi:type IV pilus assembly protein PilW
MSARWQTRRHAHRTCAGVSLIELMVALAIGSLLIIGAVTVYMQSRNTYRTNETAARLQEVARYALDTIEPDVRLAGYWGLTNRSDFVETRATPAETQLATDASVGSNCGTNWTVNVAAPIDGRDSTVTGGLGYDLGCTATTPVARGDVLIVRRAGSNTAALGAGRMQIQSTRMRAVIFKDGAMPALFDAASSETRNLIVNAYYIASAGTSPNGVAQFALRRQTLIDGPTIRDEEIIPGVEDLQIQFGIDAIAPHDGNVDRYVNPGAVPAGARIVSVRIWLRVVAEEREIGFRDTTNWAYANANYGVLGDDRRRTLVSKTIQIRNAPL